MWTCVQITWHVNVTISSLRTIWYHDSFWLWLHYGWFLLFFLRVSVKLLQISVLWLQCIIEASHVIFLHWDLLHNLERLLAHCYLTWLLILVGLGYLSRTVRWFWSHHILLTAWRLLLTWVFLDIQCSSELIRFVLNMLYLFLLNNLWLILLNYLCLHNWLHWHLLSLLFWWLQLQIYFIQFD